MISNYGKLLFTVSEIYKHAQKQSSHIKLHAIEKTVTHLSKQNNLLVDYHKNILYA